MSLQGRLAQWRASLEDVDNDVCMERTVTLPKECRNQDAEVHRRQLRLTTHKLHSAL